MATLPTFATMHWPPRRGGLLAAGTGAPRLPTSSALVRAWQTGISVLLACVGFCSSHAGSPAHPQSNACPALKTQSVAAPPTVRRLLLHIFPLPAPRRIRVLFDHHP